MGYSLDEKVKWLAIISRISVVVLQYLLNALVPDHDAGVFNKPLDNNVTVSCLDSVINSTLGGLTRWDSQYFLHVAQYGYTYENTLAFFPLFPLAIRNCAYIVVSVLNNLLGYFSIPSGELISFHTALVISSVFFNNLIFVKTACVLLKLGRIVLKNEKLSYVSCLFFCFNPASIFFSAAYSESLFCFLSLYAMLHIERNNFLLAAILFGLSGMTRSNGITNAGFLVYHYLKRCVKLNNRNILGDTLMFFTCILISVIPFVIYQIYCYMKYCLSNELSSLPDFIYAYGMENNFRFPGESMSPPWCSNSIPLAYSYVQSHYWNVGFLRYYEIKQIPNFLLATPAFAIVFTGSVSYVRVHKNLVVWLGFKEEKKATEPGHLPISAFAYVAHVFALAVFAAFVIHVQVATRLLFSSSPVPYWLSAWFARHALKDTPEDMAMKKFPNKDKLYFCENYENRHSTWKTLLFSENFRGVSLWLKYYCLTYFFLGTLMFSNFLPWT